MLLSSFIRGKVNSWIKSWLSGRNQTVIVEGVNSSQVDGDSGITQGSVLAPSLFIFYINDLQDRLRSTVRLLADDTIAYLTITSEDDAEHLQEDLDKLAQWEKTGACSSIQQNAQFSPSPTSGTP